MRRVLVTTDIKAPPTRVWRALTVPAEVTAWDGAVALDVPPGYPSPGGSARWRTRLGPVPLILHDRVVAVEVDRRLAAQLRWGFVVVAEEYRLALGAAGTVLVSDNLVSARRPALGWLAGWLVRRSVVASMARLAEHCATP